MSPVRSALLSLFWLVLSNFWLMIITAVPCMAPAWAWTRAFSLTVWLCVLSGFRGYFLYHVSFVSCDSCFCVINLFNLHIFLFLQCVCFHTRGSRTQSHMPRTTYIYENQSQQQSYYIKGSKYQRY